MVMLILIALLVFVYPIIHFAFFCLAGFFRLWCVEIIVMVYFSASGLLSQVVSNEQGRGNGFLVEM